MKKNLLVLLALGLCLGLGIGLYMYNKKVPGLESIEPDFSLTADELFDTFDNNESKALALYENKVIQVSGEIISIKNTDSSSNIIIKAENALAGGINCSYKTPQPETVKKGQNINIKGRCQGFLMDVVLNNCNTVK